MRFPATTVLPFLLSAIIISPSSAFSTKGRKLADNLNAIDGNNVEATTGFFDFGEDDFMDFSIGGGEEEGGNDSAFDAPESLLPPCQNLTLAEIDSGVACTNDTAAPTEPPELRYPDELFERLLASSDYAQHLKKQVSADKRGVARGVVWR